MKLIQDFIASKKNIRYSIFQKEAAKNKMDCCDISPDIHCRLQRVSKIFKKKISYIKVDINLHKFFINNKKTIEKNFADIFAEYYEEENPAILECFDKLREDFIKNKPIFICLDLLGYGYDEDEDYSTHSVSCIFIPLSKKEYKLIYINSHGNDITKEFDIIIAKKKRPRIKKLKFNISIDLIFMKKFVYYLNKKMSLFDEKIHVNYTGNKTDTYYGANLQCGDDYGICYAFPYIFYFYFGFYYSKARSIENIIVESSYNLLKKGKIIQFVHACMADFNISFKQNLIQIENSENKKSVELLERIVQEEGTQFIKDITIPLIKFINQKQLLRSK